VYGFPGVLPFGGFPYPVPYPEWYGGRSDIGANRSRGDFAGRGPKGYKRSDDRIREDISEHLTRHPLIDASEVEVTVDDGVVMLIGVVDDRHQKHLVEDVAADISGVRDVENALKVRHGFLASLTGEKAVDREIERATVRDETPPKSARMPAPTRR
jgi:BON domain